jgi:hypothetical protein
MIMRKILLMSVLGIALVVLSGCGSKKDFPETGTTLPLPGEPESLMEADLSVELPEATGNVDDAVDAIISGSESEAAQIMSDEEEVSSILDDTEETNNLINAYDADKF